MSPIAYALFQYLKHQAEGRSLTMEELVATLRASKTAIRAAFSELQSYGYLSYNQET